MAKKTKRQQEKYSAVEPQVNLKARYEEIMDIQEYFHDLPEYAKKWMNKFTDEYVNDVLDRKNLKKNLHNTKKLKKSCDDRNNSRNRDVLTKKKITNNLSYIEELSKKDASYNPEDDFIEKIDVTNAEKPLK